MKYLWIFALVTVFNSCVNENKTIGEQREEGLLIKNGLVYLPDGTVSKQDILIEGGQIMSIQEVLPESVEKIIDAEGKFVMPGFIDAHAHFEGIGQAKANLNLLGIKSWADILKAVEEKVSQTPEGEWIVGRGWHQDKWTDQPSKMIEANPTHDDLSAISPNNPIILDHASGHGIIANQLAMELAGISRETIAPDGGVIITDELGNPTGVFQENAELLVKTVYQKQINTLTNDEQFTRFKNFIQLAEQECLQYGITSLHDAGISKQQALWFKQLAEENKLNVRLYSMLAQFDVRNKFSTKELTELRSLENPYFTCRAIKAYMDGALGSRGAWFLEDYHDQEGYRGENVTPIEDLTEIAKIANENDFQLCIHAIGDRGNREVIDVFENELGNDILKARWRIEHAQHLHPDDIKRIGDLNIIASMQTVHCTSDSPFVEKRLGSLRAEQGAYVWQTLLTNGVHIANGTDSPVESVNPFENMYAGVTRKRIGENTAFYEHQKLTRNQVLDSYTKWNAYAAFQEDVIGVLNEGSLADIVILDTNLLECTDQEILNTKVLYTIVNGEIKYERKNNI